MIKTVEISELKGIEILEILHSLDPRLREAAWQSLTEHEIYKFIRSANLKLVVVDGGWFRRFLGHVAVDSDLLLEMRRTYPPITDKDLIFIKNYD